MPADDCVRTLAGEGESYREARVRVQRLNDVLDDATLDFLATAQRVRDKQYPVLMDRRPTETVEQAGARLREALARETFYEYLSEIRQATQALSEAYAQLYAEFHRRRNDVYAGALDRIKRRPEWTQGAGHAGSGESRQDTRVARLTRKICPTLQLDEGADTCSRCRATIDQMESDIAAVDALAAEVVRALQALAAPDQKIARVRVSDILGNTLERPEDVEHGIERLKEHLLKLLAEGARIILE